METTPVKAAQRGLWLILLGVCTAAFAFAAFPPGLAQKEAPAKNRGATDPVAIARHFLPPHAELATLYTFDYRTLKFGPDYPAVLEAHVVTPTSEDIAFAYYSPRAKTMSKTLFLDLLAETHDGYEKLYEISYRPQTLFVPKAIRIIHLEGVSTDAVAVMHGVGADLGGRLDVLVWRNPWGWQNVFPSNGGTHYFYFFARRAGLEVALSAARHPGLNVTPPPTWYRWDGGQFGRITAPKGSSKWPLPD